VAVVCPDPQVRETLGAHLLGGHLIVTASLASAVSAVLATPALTVASLRVAAHPSAPRASRDFVTRTLLDRRLTRVIPFASLVVSELVASSMINAGTDIDVSVVWDPGALRLNVRDHGPAIPNQRRAGSDLQGRRLKVVSGLSSVFGVLPTADGGKVHWAVLETPKQRTFTRRIRLTRDATNHESPAFTDSHGLAELPFCAGANSHQLHQSPPAHHEIENTRSPNARPSSHPAA
jgi:hypothetical protein